MDILSNIEIYTNRTSRAYNKLDDAHFDWRNEGWGGSVHMLADVGGYCLDAPEQLPTGSMKGYGKRPGTVWTGMGLASRDWLDPEELARRNALAEQLIAEILADSNT